MNRTATGHDKSIEDVYHAPWEFPKLEESLSSEDKSKLQKEVKSHSQLRSSLFIFHLIIDWAEIALIIYLSVKVLPFYFYPLAIILIATRQHALLVLMHDAVHFTFLKRHRVADAISNIFAAFPMLITTENFRYSHLLHHRFLNSENDPDLNVKKQRSREWVFPKTRGQILSLLAYESFGGGFLEVLRKLKRFSLKNSYTVKGKPNSNIYFRLGFYICLLAALVELKAFWIFAIYWLVPILFVLPVFLKIRSIGDHFGLPGTDQLNSSRNFIIPWWQKYIFAPHNIGVHVVHHLYPSVPYYNLLKMDKALKSLGDYDSKVHQTTSIISFRKGGLFYELESIQPKLRME